MDEATDWNDLKLRLISALFLIFCQFFLRLLWKSFFYIFYYHSCWSNALGIGKNVITYVQPSNVV